MIPKQGIRIKGIKYFGKVSLLETQDFKYPKELIHKTQELTLNEALTGRPQYTKCLFINNDGSISISKSKTIRKIIDQLNDTDMLRIAVIYMMQCKTRELSQDDFKELHEYFQFEYLSKRYANEYGISPPTRLEIKKKSGNYEYTYRYISE